jgi:hypothetical protein
LWQRRRASNETGVTCQPEVVRPPALRVLKQETGNMQNAKLDDARKNAHADFQRAFGFSPPPIPWGSSLLQERMARCGIEARQIGASEAEIEDVARLTLVQDAASAVSRFHAEGYTKAARTDAGWTVAKVKVPTPDLHRALKRLRDAGVCVYTEISDRAVAVAVRAT